MIPSGDGFMYILTKNVVHRLDGTLIGGGNGTLTANLLTAPAHYFLSHGIDYRSNLYIVVQRILYIKTKQYCPQMQYLHHLNVVSMYGIDNQHSLTHQTSFQFQG